MEYIEKTKEELISRIEELETLNKQLLDEKEKEDTLDFPWTGNLGHWYWNIKTNNVTFNPLKASCLGYTKEEIPENVPYQFFTDKLHPDDYQPTMEVMMEHLTGESDVYEVEYRIKAKDGSYKSYYDRGKITTYDKNNKPLLLAGIVFDMTDKKNMEEELLLKNKQLFEQSYTDDLTKVKNRRYIIERLSREIEKHTLNESPLSICIFDIDYFKSINDNYGHLAGDKVLIEVAEIMKNNIRNSDFVGRYGGEEFMIVFTNTRQENALLVCERIRKAIEDHIFYKDIIITISGGLYESKGK